MHPSPRLKPEDQIPATSPVRKRQPANLRDRLFPTPDHGAVDASRHGFLQIGARVLKARKKNPLGQEASGIHFLKFFHQVPRYSDKASRYSDEAAISAQKRTGKG